MSRVGLYADTNHTQAAREHRAAVRRRYFAKLRNARRDPVADAPEPVELLDTEADDFFKEHGW